MIDPIDSLAFALYSSPGVYVPLLGSGVSRAAGIPTGWEVIEDLVRRYAAQADRTIDGEPASWYKQQTGREPDYSELLSELAPARAERQALLRGYFEPTEDEAERGLKRPTSAHRAIARLVQLGHVRVVLTTNFDRLLEQALEAEGIQPIVLSYPAAIDGAPPLAHANCTVIKLHGDYLDTRVRNTQAELENYPRSQKRILRQVLDEYGLIVAGWSGQWDVALRQELSATKHQRFMTFWAAMSGNLTEEARLLVALRRARVIDIQSADQFFGELARRVEALNQFDRLHPLSVEISIAELKRYLPRPEYRIQAHDLLHRHVEVAFERCFSGEPSRVRPDAASMQDQLGQYEAAVEAVEKLVLLGARWGETSHDSLWLRVIERLGNPPAVGGGVTVWLNLRYYPATRLIYLCGLGALVEGRFDLLWRLFNLVDQSERTMPKMIIKANPGCMNGPLVQEILGQRYRLPESQYLLESLRSACSTIIPDERNYRRQFNLFEYLLSLAMWDADEWACPGLYLLGRDVELIGDPITDRDGWPPLQGGFLGGDADRLVRAAQALAEAATQFRRF